MSFWYCGFVILVFLTSVVSLSHADPITEQKQDQVFDLPGQNFNVDFSQYAGYVTVNEENGRALFYWLTEATQDPASKPLVLWLNGGPGCSSIAYGMSEEVGPFHVDKDGKSVYSNPYSWNTVANLLFIDSPVGVGYSYSNTSADIESNGDKRTAEDLLQFLLNWLERFPQYKGRDFYMTGESYAGHYVPQLSQVIVRYNKENTGSPINLLGYMVGNALTDDYHDHLGLFQFLWTVGMISDQTYKKLNDVCAKSFYVVHPSPECGQITENMFQELGNIDHYSIFTPSCTANDVNNRLLRKWHKFGYIGRSYDPCTKQHSTIYFNLPEVQKALHVYHSNTSRSWEACSNFVEMSWQDSPLSVLDVYHELIAAGLRIWMFSGDTDGIIPVTSTRYTINALNLTTISPWRAWYEDGQVFIPVSHGAHKFVVCFNLKKPAVVVFDNKKVHDPTNSDCMRVATNMQRRFGILMKNRNHEKSDEFTKSVVTIGEFHWQTDKKPNESGVFVMRHMEDYMGMNIQRWDCGLLRKKYAARLLLSDCNTMKNKIEVDLKNYRAANAKVKKNKVPIRGV